MNLTTITPMGYNDHIVDGVKLHAVYLFIS